jgi:hypothetical protein
MKRLKIALALEEDVLDRIENHGIETIDLTPSLEILVIGLLHFLIYMVAASVISRNMEGLVYRFYNGLYEISFDGFLRLFW